MKIVIQVLVEKDIGAAVVGRLAGVLHTADLEYLGHAVFAADESRRRLALLAESGHLDESRLRRELGAVDGVYAVLEVDASGSAALDGIVPTEHVEAELLNELVWEYPRVLPVIDRFVDGLRRDEREHRVTRLGVEAGERLAGAFPGLAHATDLHDALERIVLPALRSIAVGEVSDTDLRISSSVFVRRNLDMMYMSVGGEARNCCFVTGLVLGLLRCAPGLPAVRVQETECRDRGDGCCNFHVAPV